MRTDKVITQKVVLDERQKAALTWAIEVALAAFPTSDYAYTLGEMEQAAPLVQKVTVRLSY